MNKHQRRSVRSLLLLSCFFVNATFADSCFELYKLDEPTFTLQAQQAPAAVYTKLNQCVANNACSFSPNMPVCMQNLNYYDAMAAFYYQQSLSSSKMQALAPKTLPPTPPVSNTPTQQPLTDDNDLQPIIAAPPSNNNSGNNDIYKDIRF